MTVILTKSRTYERRHTPSCTILQFQLDRIGQDCTSTYYFYCSEMCPCSGLIFRYKTQWLHEKTSFSLMTIQNISTLLGTEEVAAYLKIRPRTVLAWVQQGRLPKPIRIGKAPLWEERGLSARLDEARIQRDASIAEPRKGVEKSRVKPGKGFTKSKELQLMVSLK